MVERAERYRKIRQKIFDILGGKCVQCSTSTNLQIDHVDPEEKAFDVSRLWAYAFATIEEELKKCQILCKPCHIAKHAVAKGTHGTLSAFRHCKCDLCKKAKSDWQWEYNAKRRGPPKHRQKAKCGMRSNYRYCKCQLCRNAQNAYMKEYNRRKRSRA